MKNTRPRLPIESTRHFAHSVTMPVMASIAKSRMSPQFCAIIVRNHE